MSQNLLPSNWLIICCIASDLIKIIQIEMILILMEYIDIDDLYANLDLVMSYLNNSNQFNSKRRIYLLGNLAFRKISN